LLTKKQDPYNAFSIRVAKGEENINKKLFITSRGKRGGSKHIGVPFTKVEGEKTERR